MRAVALGCFLLAACGEAAGKPDGGPAGPSVPLTVTLPPLELAPGEERLSVCQSVTLENEEPLFVNRVAFDAGPGWHHSIWYFVEDDLFDGPDGTWECEERDFDLAAASFNGGVLYAQSTQAEHEVQALPAGVAIAIPRHARLIGQIHTFNGATEPLTTHASLELTRLAAAEVTTRVVPLALSFDVLHVPPGESESVATCDFTESVGEPLDVGLYWVLPHYHVLGRRLWVEVDTGDGLEPLFETEGSVGEPLGGPLEPVRRWTGSRIRFGCAYENPTGRTVGYGLSADDEMCIAMILTDSELLLGGQVGAGGTCRTSAAPSSAPWID